MSINFNSWNILADAGVALVLAKYMPRKFRDVTTMNIVCVCSNLSKLLSATMPCIITLGQ